MTQKCVVSLYDLNLENGSRASEFDCWKGVDPYDNMAIRSLGLNCFTLDDKKEERRRIDSFGLMSEEIATYTSGLREEQTNQILMKLHL